LQILAIPFLYANPRSGFSIAVGFKIVWLAPASLKKLPFLVGYTGLFLIKGTP
jgi:hypothetical protein